MAKNGTKITYRSIGRNPDGDNRINTRHISKIRPDTTQFKRLLKDDKVHFMHITDFNSFAVNKLKYNRKRFLMLEPNPVTFYFSIAFDLIPQLEKAKQQLREILVSDFPNETALAIIYSNIYRISSVGVIFSLTAIEAFMNQELPDYKEINFKNKRATKDEIQRRASFDEKLLSIIPNVSQKNFNEKYPKQTELLKKYKKLRDELVHLKQKRTDGLASYDNIYQNILNVDLKKLVFVIKKYINYHKPQTIQNYKKKVQI